MSSHLNNNTNNTKQRIILLDSNFELSELMNLKKSTDQIITFDFKSHKLLNVHNIHHKISDDFLNKKELDLIQERSYELVKWYENQNVSKHLDFEGLNLGKIFYIEFHYFLIPFLKKFLEISKIFQKFQNSEFLSVLELAPIIQNFSNHVSTFGSQTKNPFIYERIKFQLTNSFSINISKTKYQKIKHISENILLSTLKSKNQKSLNNVFFIEFDTLRYKDLITKFHDKNFNLILFNRRRPYVWNLKTYAIAKQSKCDFITEQDFTNTILEEIHNEQKLYEKNIDLLLKNESFFITFFSICDLSFWDVIKARFSDLLRRRIFDGIREFIFTKTIFKKYAPSIILLWSESGLHEQIVIHLSKKFNIKTILLQHGVFNDDVNSFKLNSFSGNICNMCDEFLVWGNVLKNYCISQGIPKNKLKILGSPSYDRIFSVSKKTHSNNENYILLATTAPRKFHFSGHLNSANDFYDRSLQEICKIVSSLGKNLVIKLHPFEYEQHITKDLQKKFPSVTIVSRGDIIPLLSKCELFITLSVSSTILEGQILNKPIINIKTNYDAWGEPYILRNNSCLKVSLENFRENLENLLVDKNLKNQIILNGKNSVNEYLVNLGNSSEKILKYIESLCENKDLYMKD